MSETATLLRDEIVLRRASINDARREFEDGELSSDQFASLQQRELAAISRCEAQIAELGVDAPSALGPVRDSAGRRPARKHRRRYLTVALVSFAAAAMVLVVNAVVPRQPGASDTGGISTSQAQRIHILLSQGEVDEAVGNTTNALVAFNQVLSLQKKNVEALTQSGWLYFSAGSAARNLSIITLGEHRVALAVATYPNDPDPLLYYAIIAASTPDKQALARQKFKKFLTLHPSASDRAIARPWLLRLGVSSS
jgi:hypothetical protein